MEPDDLFKFMEMLMKKEPRLKDDSKLWENGKPEQGASALIMKGKAFAEKETPPGTPPGTPPPAPPPVDPAGAPEKKKPPPVLITNKDMALDIKTDSSDFTERQKKVLEGTSQEVLLGMIAPKRESGVAPAAGKKLAFIKKLLGAMNPEWVVDEQPSQTNPTAVTPPPAPPPVDPPGAPEKKQPTQMFQIFPAAFPDNPIAKRMLEAKTGKKKIYDEEVKPKLQEIWDIIRKYTGKTDTP
eukprot:gene6630-14146_t